MTSRWLAAAALLIVTGCLTGDSLDLSNELEVPRGLTIAPVAVGSVRLEWAVVPGATIVGYQIERRENLQGDFAVLETLVPQNLPGPMVYFDRDLPPDTFFGYRVTAVDRLGNMSAASTVGGARTPSLPGIQVSTAFLGANPLLADQDGYTIVVEGPETRRGAIGTTDARRFSPLTPGVYTVRLEGVAAACSVQSGATRTVTVSDQTVETIAAAFFPVTCRDATRGEIALAVVIDGVPPSLTEFTVQVAGIASDNTLPEGDRLYTRTLKYGPAGGGTLLEDLRPGAYQVSLPTVPTLCVREGSATREVDVTPLSTAAVRFDLRCASTPTDPNDPRRPFLFLNEWSAASTSPGSTVELGIALDLSQIPSAELGAVQAELRYDPAVVRFDRIDAGDTRFSVFGNASSGRVLWSAFTTTSGASGRVAVARMSFTVVGQAGTRALTRSTGISATARDFSVIDTLIRIREDTLPIVAGTPNQTPVAEANGPYLGVVGAAVQFSAAGSTDPDGMIASYAWTFGDGGTATGAMPTHSYATAGAYTVRVTVTDDRGATATDQSPVTITGGGGGTNLPPVPRINGPYVGVVGGAVPFSALGSSDPDGTVATYAWSFGDGTTGSGPSVAKSYATAGTFSVSLTVTDNGGTAATATTTATITSAPSTTPFTWASTIGVPTSGIIPVAITLDLSPNIAETPVSEALSSWSVQALTWDPQVLQFFAFSFGSNATGTVDPTNVQQGRLTFSGSLPGLGATGLINIATVRFRPVGTPGSSTTLTTTLGPLLGSVVTGGYNYRAQTRIVEATYTVPGGAPPTGSVAGTVRNTLNAPLPSVLVTLTPGGTTLTNSQGAFVQSVPVGSGTVSVSGLPSGCTVPAALPYAVGVAGQTVVVNVTVNCSSGPPPTGTISGTLTRSSGGPLVGATVSANGVATITDPQGGYALTVPVGSGTVSVSGVPVECTVPAGQGYTVSSSGQSVVVNFSVTCTAPPPTGTISGTLTRSTGGPVSGATVSAGGVSAISDALGQYTLSVPVGSGTVTVAGVPGGCTAPPAQAYAVTSPGQVVGVDFTVTCQAPPPVGNTLIGTWTVTGSTATLEIRINIASGNVLGVQGRFTANSARLQYAGTSPATAPLFPNGTAGNPPQTTIVFGAFSTAAAGETGDRGIIRLNFTILPGAATTVNGSFTAVEITDKDFNDVLPAFLAGISVAPLALP